jgi:hypothetical protein
MQILFKLKSRTIHFETKQQVSKAEQFILKELKNMKSVRHVSMSYTELRHFSKLLSVSPCRYLCVSVSVLHSLKYKQKYFAGIKAKNNF